MSRQKEYIYLAVLIIIALALRLFLPYGPVMPDSALYLKLAEKIGQGQLILDSPFHSQNIIQPGYSFVIYLFNLLINNWRLSGIIVSLLAGVLLVFVMYFFGKSLFNKRVGLLSALVIAIYPLFISYSAKILTESIFAFIFMVIVYLFWLILHGKRSYYWYILLGLLVGFSYLIRIAGLFSLVAVIMWLIISWLILKRINTRQVIISFILFIVSAVLVIAPYLIYLQQKNHTFVLTGMQDMAIYAQDELLVEKVLSRADIYQLFLSLTDDKTDYSYNKLNGNVLKHKNDLGSLITLYARNFISNIVYNIKFFVITFLVEIVCIFYFLYAYIKKKKSLINFWYIVSWIPFLLAIYGMTRPFLRYYYPIIPLLIILSANGIIIFARNIKVNLIRYFTLLVIIAIWLVYSLLLNVFVHHDYVIAPAKLLVMSDSEKVGLWLQQQYGRNLRVLSTNQVVSYFADAVHYPLPFADYESVLYFAQHNAINFIIVDNKINYYASTGLDTKLNTPGNKDLLLIKKEGKFTIYKIIY